MPVADDADSSPGEPETRLSTSISQIVRPDLLQRAMGNAMRQAATRMGRNPLSRAADARRSVVMLPPRINIPRVGFGVPGR
jgi:hypothetical protein